MDMKNKKPITRQEVNHIIEKYRIRIGPFTIREDGLLDVSGNVKICHTNLQKLPLKFGNVYGNFLCHSNQLTSLKGCPTYVAGDFNCYSNNLKSLKYGPAEVGGNFLSHENNLTSLKGSPKIINGNFSCFLNQLTTLKNGPIKVNGSYYACKNQLVTLEGSPNFVGGSFRVGANLLTDLVGCPEYIGDILSFDNDVKIYLGNKNCKVKIVTIQIKEMINDSDKYLPSIVINNQRQLPIVFKYSRYLDCYDSNGCFNESNFNDIIFEIKDGLL